MQKIALIRKKQDELDILINELEKEYVKEHNILSTKHVFEKKININSEYNFLSEPKKRLNSASSSIYEEDLYSDEYSVGLNLDDYDDNDFFNNSDSNINISPNLAGLIGDTKNNQKIETDWKPPSFSGLNNSKAFMWIIIK